MIQTAVAGHVGDIGIGPPFGSSGFDSGIFGTLFGGRVHSTAASGSGARFSFGGRPTPGQRVIGRSPSRITGSPGRLTTRSHQRDPMSSTDRQSTANSRLRIASRLQWPRARTGDQIFSRLNASVHRDYDRRSAHYWRGHRWGFG